MEYICMIVDAAYPKDIRVRKEAESLQKGGKNVLIVCPNYNDKKFEIINGVCVYRIGKNYTKTKKGIHDIIESVFNINLFFFFGIKKVLKKYSIKYIHVHDLPLAGTGYFFRKKVDGLILDLHENYPEALQVWFSWNKNPLKRWKNAVFMNFKLWARKERKYCKNYDKIICVVEEMKQRLIDKFEIEASKIQVICNKETLEFLENNEKSDLIDKNSFSITYIGGLGPHRGIDTVIKSIKEIIKEIKEVKFYIVGAGGSSDTENHLKELAVEYGVVDYVEFVGYRPFNQVYSIMNQSSINIVPHNKGPHTNSAIPHKFFQIMMSKGLLLASSCAPLERYINKYDAGVVFEAGNSKDLAKKMIDIYNDYDHYKEKANNAFKAVIETENWENESDRLIKFYNTLS